MNKLLPPNTAPKDGTLILADIGYPFLLPAVWNEHSEEWVTATPQASKMQDKTCDWWFESEHEKHSELKGWIDLEKITDLPDLQKEQYQWASKVFPDQTAESVFDHLKDEINELGENLNDETEIADCLLLILNLASKANIDALEVAKRKLEINKSRKWGKPDSRGVVHHIE